MSSVVNFYQEKLPQVLHCYIKNTPISLIREMYNYNYYQVYPHIADFIDVTAVLLIIFI